MASCFPHSPPPPNFFWSLNNLFTVLLPSPLEAINQNASTARSYIFRIYYFLVSLGKKPMWQVWGSHNCSFNTGWQKLHLTQISTKKKVVVPPLAPHYFKNGRVLQTLARFLPATIRLLSADCCPVQRACLLGSFHSWSHPSLWHPLTPGWWFKEGSPWVQASPVSFAICHHRAAWSDTVDREITITSLAQGIWQSGSIRQDKITVGWGSAEPGSREIHSSSCSAREMLTVP